MPNEPVKPFRRIGKPDVVAAPQAQTIPGTAVLPPAGDARREVLKERTDKLEEQAATQLADVTKIDVDRLEIERELSGHFNALDVSNADPVFVYKWVNFSSNGGIMLRSAIAPPERWEVVSGDMKEATELKAVDGTRKLGDVLLLRMPKARYDIIVEVRAKQAERQQKGYENELAETGRKNGIKVYNNSQLPDNIQSRLTKPSQSAMNAMRGAEAAGKQYDAALRTGAL